MRAHPLGILVAVVGFAACTTRNGDPRSADTAASPSPSPPRSGGSPDATAPPGTSTTGWTVTPSGIGPIEVGMSVADLRRVAGDLTLPSGGAGSCAYVHPSTVPAGVSIMLANGSVARVDVDSAGVRTAEGAAVGDAETRIDDLYAGRVTVTPHKYVQDARYLTVSPAAQGDSTHRIVFEVERGRVARFRAGRLPEVSWVERCG